MKRFLLLVILFLLVALSSGMELVGSLDGFTNALFCVPNGNYLYLLNRFTLYSIDISEPSSPEIIDSIVTSGYVLDVALDGDYAFLGSGNNLLILDISDPAHPENISSVSFSSSDYVYNIYYQDGYVFAAATNIFKIFEFTAPDTLNEIYSYPYATSTVSCWNDYAVLGVSSGGGGGLIVLDITNPASPTAIGGMSTSGFAVDVDFDGGNIYLADGAEVGIGTGHVLLMQSSDFHSEAGRFTSSDGDCRHGCSNGNQYLVANGNDGFILLDWASPASPEEIDDYPTTGYAADANIQYPYIYAVTRTQLLVLSSSELVDTGGPDITGPTVTLLEPEDGSFSSCLNQQVRFLITDDRSGVDWSSVRLTIDDIEFPGDALYQNGDTIAFIPMIEYIDGHVIDFSLTAVSDLAGNSASGLPISNSSTIDYSPPLAVPISPADGDTAYISTPTITFSLIDSISGLDSSSANYSLDSSPILSSEFGWTETSMGYNLTYTPSSPLADGIHTFCITGLSDNARYCSANSLPIYCWSFYTVISTVDTFPPVCTIIMPYDGTYTSCSDQQIVLHITDVGGSGVDASSISLMVNGTTYSTFDPELNFSSDTLTFTPSTAYPEGAIPVSLISYADTAGNDGTPISFEFNTDYTAPVISSVYPADGDTVDDATPSIQIMVDETGAGINPYSITFRVNGSLVLAFLTTLPSGGIITYTPSVSFADSSLVTVSLENLADTVDYCEPNIADNYEWSFYIDLSDISESKIPGKPILNVLPNPFNSVVDIHLILPNMEYGELIIMDNSGRVVEKLFDGTTKNISTNWTSKSNPSGIYRVIWKGATRLSNDIILVK
ncbi:hypothetical protein J7L68_02730 [bacterium]|nr:hypothetical protein [bacterium]